MKSQRISNDEQWRGLRGQHVGGSEVAALFGEHAQLTKFELWQMKKGHLAYTPIESTRMFWGSTLEPAIAAGVAAQTGWQIRKVRRYFSMLPDVGLGGSLDYEIVSHERGAGILEIKNADWLVVRDWEYGEPPLSYELQVQSYLAVTGRRWGCIAVLVGGNDLRRFEYERREETIAIIRENVQEFWGSIAANKPPPPDWTRDAATITRLYQSVTAGKTINLAGSNRAPELIDNYMKAQADEKDAGERKAAAKSELLTLIGDHEYALCGAAKISAKSVKEAHISYDRKPYRDFRISVSQKKAQAA